MSSEQQFSKICSQHHLEHVAVDINPQCEAEKRFLCIKCLALPHDQLNRKTMDEAQNYLQEIKTVFTQRKQKQTERNEEILKEVFSSLSSLLIEFRASCEKILENLRLQENHILNEKQELDSKLEKVDLYKYFFQKPQISQIQYDLMKEIIANQITNLKNFDKIDQCLQQLKNMDDAFITFASNSQQINVQNKMNQRNPSLKILCSQHQQEIIGFDLSDDIAKANKIVCSSCALNNSNKKIDLNTAQQQWQDYENEKKSLLQTQLNKGRIRIDTAQFQFKQVLNKFEHKINEANSNLESIFDSIDKEVSIEICQLNQDWSKLQKEEIINIAHTLSQLPKQDKLIQIDFKQEEINNLIDDSIKYLNDTLLQCKLGINNKQQNIVRKHAEVQTKVNYQQINCSCENFYGGYNNRNIISELQQQIDQLKEDLKISNYQSEQLQLKNKEYELEVELQYSLKQQEIQKQAEEIKQLQINLQSEKRINFDSDRSDEEANNQILAITDRNFVDPIQKQLQLSKKIKSEQFSNKKVFKLDFQVQKLVQQQKNKNDKHHIEQKNSLVKSSSLNNSPLKTQDTKYNSLINALNNVKKQEQVVNEMLYQIIHEFPKNVSCFSIAFSKDASIMVAGQEDSKIVVFSFKQGFLTVLQELTDHTSKKQVMTLFFCTKINQFISGTSKEIGIWSYNSETQKYKLQQLLKTVHQSEVNRVIMNENENFIISCSSDKTIKFWIRKNKWECYQTLATNYIVHSICLNEEGTQLFSCGQDKQICIYEMGVDKYWTGTKTIKVGNFGTRICFIDDQNIAFQPFNGTKLEFYQRDVTMNQYTKISEISVKKDVNCQIWFPMNFNQKKQIVLSNNGGCVNLITKTKDAFVLTQSINFSICNGNFGAMTDDGNYIVIWDDKNKKYQVRKFMISQ